MRCTSANASALYSLERDLTRSIRFLRLRAFEAVSLALERVCSTLYTCMISGLIAGTDNSRFLVRALARCITSASFLGDVLTHRTPSRFFYRTS